MKTERISSATNSAGRRWHDLDVSFCLAKISIYLAAVDVIEERCSNISNSRTRAQDSIEPAKRFIA